MISYLMKIYYEKVIWDLYYYFNIINLMNIPKINKIVINFKCFKIFLNKNKINPFLKSLYSMFFQKPFIVKCKKSISEFGIKKNDKISLKITLRNVKMYDFFYKFLKFYVNLIKNFTGFSEKSFDKFGNYNLGITDCSNFPEFDNNLEFLQGFDININFKNSNTYKSLKLLKLFNFPFKNV